MTPDQEAIIATLAFVLTSAGALVGAGIVSAIIQFLKGVPGIPTQGHERRWAFGLSAGLVIVAYASVTVLAQPPAAASFLGLLGALLAWFNVARNSMSLYDDVTRRPGSLTGPRV